MDLESRQEGSLSGGRAHRKWDEWRVEWCWIVEENPQPFTALRQAPIVRGNDWSNVAPEDDRLKIAVTRILRLRLAGLTVGAVGEDFLCRRIAPLQERGRPAWEFQNSADIMRLHPGLNFSFTVLELDAMLLELFKRASFPAFFFSALYGAGTSIFVRSGPVGSSGSGARQWIRPAFFV